MDPVVRQFAIVMMVHAALVGFAILGAGWMITGALDRREEKP